jgi:hypothetical protein
LIALGMLTLGTTSALAQGEKTIVVHTGKVVKIDRGDPAVVVVKTEKADLDVELGPVTYLEENRLTLAPDEAVSIRGYEEKRGDRTVFVATEVTSGDRVVKFRDPAFKPLWTVKSTAVEQQPVTIVTYAGKVKAFTRSDPAVVVLETDKGEVTTELAPITYVDENKLVLSPSDTITVKGYQTMRDGKPVFVATELTTGDRRVVRFRSEAREPLWVKTSTETTTIVPGEITDLSGDVTVVETTDTPDGRFVTIKTDSGPRVIAVAPGSYLTKHRYAFAPGDRIRVRGWASTRAGRPVFLASEVHRGDAVWRFRRADGRVLWID